MHWRWPGLTNRTHQIRWNIELPGRAKPPSRREGLASEAPNSLLAEIDTVRIVGSASQHRLFAIYRYTLQAHMHIEERIAVRLDQRFLTHLALHK